MTVEQEYQKVLYPIIMATPFVLASNFDDFSRCVDASHAIVEVLNRCGYHSTARSCAMWVTNRADKLDIVVGSTSDRFRGEFGLDQATLAAATKEVRRADNVPLHAVVTATIGSRQLLLDPTFGQISEFGFKTQLARLFPFEDMPQKYETGDGLTIVYVDIATNLPAPVPTRVMRMANQYKEIMPFASDSGLSQRAFESRLQEHDQEVWKKGARMLDLLASHQTLRR